MLRQFWKTHSQECRLFLTVWLVYLINIAPITGANENRYIDLVRAIVDEGRFEIDTLHYNTIDKSYRDGHYYAGAAPGPAFLAIPGYLLYRLIEPRIPVDLFSQYDKNKYIRGYLKGTDAPDGFVQTYPFGRFIILHFLLTGLTCSLMAALMTVALFRLFKAKGVDVRWSYGLALAFAFGTTVFFYSTRLYAHVLGTGFVFFAFYLLALPKTCLKPVPNQSIFWSGCFLGLAIASEYNVLPSVIAVGIYLLLTVRDRRVGFGFVGGVIPILLLLWYHTVCFGGPFNTAYGLPNGLVDDGNHIHWNENFHGFGIPPLKHLWGLSFGFFRGIFWYVPLTILCFFGLGYLLQRNSTFRLEGLTIVGIITGQLLFNAMMPPNYWFGGWDFGPRFLTPIIPFMMLGFIGILPLKSSIQSIFIGLGLVSFLINWAGVQYGPSDSLLISVSYFMLSGPSTPLFLFLKEYLGTYSTWAVTVSPWGIFLVVGVLLYITWCVIPEPKNEK